MRNFRWRDDNGAIRTGMQVIHLRGFDLPPPEVAEVEIDTHMSSKASATVAAFQPSLSVPRGVKQLRPHQAVAEPHRAAHSHRSRRSTRSPE